MFLIDSIRVLEDTGHIEVRAVQYAHDGAGKIVKETTRHVVDPGLDGCLDGQDPLVVAHAKAAWTPELIQARKDFLAAQKAENDARRQKAEAALAAQEAASKKAFDDAVAAAVAKAVAQ